MIFNVFIDIAVHCNKEQGDDGMVFDKRYRPIDIKIVYRFKYIKRVNYMMKKKIQLGSMIALFFSGVLSAQSVGINTDTPNKSAAMHVSVSKDFRPATAEAVIAGNKLVGINVLDGGFGYKTAPTVVIGGGGATAYADGARAIATATIDSKTGAVTAVTVNDGGNRYEILPDILFVNNDEGVQRGLVLPRVELTSLLNTDTPINIPPKDTDGDGLLVYRAGQGEDGVPSWYEKNEDRWYEAASAFKSPKIAVFSFRQNVMNVPINTAGTGRFLAVNMYREAVSNLQGVDRYNDEATIKLPKVAGTYMVEATINLITHPDTQVPSRNLAYGNNCHPTNGHCSAPITADGYQYMGYFGQLNLFNARSASMADQSQMFTRKEDNVITKIGEKHTITFLFTVTLTASSFSATAEPYFNFRLGRMNGSSYYLPVDVLAEGSFIKIQKID